MLQNGLETFAGVETGPSGGNMYNCRKSSQAGLGVVEQLGN